MSMLSPLKDVLLEYCTLLVRIYWNQFVKLTILATKVNHKLMVDIKCLLTLAIVVPILVAIFKALVVFAQSLSVYVCDFTRGLDACILDIHYIIVKMHSYHMRFVCIVRIYESIQMRQHSHVNNLAPCLWGPPIHINMITPQCNLHRNRHSHKELCNKRVVRSQTSWRCFLNLCGSLYPCRNNVLGFVVAARCNNKDGHGTWEPVPQRDVIHALFIVYPQFWLELGHKYKVTCYMTMLKAAVGYSRNISQVFLLCMQLAQQFWMF